MLLCASKNGTSQNLLEEWNRIGRLLVVEREEGVGTSRYGSYTARAYESNRSARLVRQRAPTRTAHWEERHGGLACRLPAHRQMQSRSTSASDIQRSVRHLAGAAIPRAQSDTPGPPPRTRAQNRSESGHVMQAMSARARGINRVLGGSEESQLLKSRRNARSRGYRGAIGASRVTRSPTGDLTGPRDLGCASEASREAKVPQTHLIAECEVVEPQLEWRGDDDVARSSKLFEHRTVSDLRRSAHKRTAQEVDDGARLGIGRPEHIATSYTCWTHHELDCATTRALRARDVLASGSFLLSDTDSLLFGQPGRRCECAHVRTVGSDRRHTLTHVPALGASQQSQQREE
eukprot:scaffold193257_cov28-Tisochrysis_lutea.AAC.2